MKYAAKRLLSASQDFVRKEKMLLIPDNDRHVLLAGGRGCRYPCLCYQSTDAAAEDTRVFGVSPGARE